MARSPQQTFCDSRAGHMEHQQQWDAEAKAELPPLPARKAQIAPHVNRPQCVQIMDQQRREENGGAYCGPPRIHEDSEGGFGSLKRDEQKAVRHQVAEYESKQHETADEPEVVPPNP